MLGGGKTQFYVSPQGRTLKTALAIAEAFHPKIKRKLRDAHVNLPEQKALALLREINGKTLERLRSYDRRRIKPWDDSETPRYGLGDVHNLYRGFSRRSPTHLVIVSHVEILGPLLNALARLNPDLNAHYTKAVEQLEHFTLRMRKEHTELEFRGRKFTLPPISSF